MKNDADAVISRDKHGESPGTYDIVIKGTSPEGYDPQLYSRRLK